MAITPRQRELFDYLNRFIGAYGHAPTMAEMCAHLGLTAPSSVHHLLTALESEGLIRRVPNAARAVEIIADQASDECDIPLLGVIAAGQPIEAVLSNDVICVPRDMLGKNRTFALKVRGDSMTGDGIFDGDFIIVDSSQSADNGQTVVALVDDSDATVKRFYKERGGIRLVAANPRYKSILIKPADRLRIQGVVIGLIRKYQGARKR